jgi:glycerophosphoryl diester phosphodiesterase
MVAFLLVGLLAYGAEPCAEIKLIAHRGGVVDEQHAENTLASLQEAIQRGYWMVEVDIRRSKDGELVVQHDKGFQRLYGVKQDVADLAWGEIRQLRSRIGGQPPCTFGELAACCRGKTRLMVDTQETGSQGGFFEKIEQILRENELLSSAFFIGAREQKAYFKGKARVAVDRDGLNRAVAAGEAVSSLYFLFEHGNVLDEPTVEYARSLDVPVVASVNTEHYLIRRGVSKPETDIPRLRKSGVTYFQIDSAFEEFLDKGQSAISASETPQGSVSP